jgi:Family of unknown function (DUF6101)
MLTSSTGDMKMAPEHSLAPAIAAPKPGVGAPRRIEASDPRADGRRRIVLLGREKVEIARSVGGVFMHIALAPDAYRGVVLRLSGARDGAFHYELVLAHRDPDLSVILLEADDDSEIRAEWRLWARFLRLPTLVERQDGRPEPELARLGEVAILPPGPRRRGKAMTSRRARFLTRRKTGRAELAIAVEASREIFPGSKLDR